MIGTRLGNWIIDKELGSGGMGHVYLAHEDPPRESEGRRAAIKVLAAELALDPGFQQRFQREIDALRNLDHPAIVHFYEAGEQDRHYYYVMEYVDGRTFEDLLRERGKLSWSEVLESALQVSTALKHAHDRGVIHRDIKPSNLMRTAEGDVKLTDFGIAHVFASSPLTLSGVVVGTAEFLSPEQAMGKPVSKRSDLYSLGVVLYTLLTGRTPFQGESTLDLMHKHCYAQFDRPEKLVPEVPHELADVICKLLEKDPAKRPPDGMVLHRQLDSIRRRIEFREAKTRVMAPADTSEIEDDPLAEMEGELKGPGPATLMSQLMRDELERQNRVSPLGRLLNKPPVLLSLLILATGLIAWAFWPASPESLFRRGAALMASEDPDDWDRAWRQYLAPLESKYPDHPYQEEVANYRRQLDEYEAQRKAERGTRNSGPAGEGQWFYLQGLRLRQQGDEAAARRVWENIIQGFREVPTEQTWVRRAQEQLEKAGVPPSTNRLAPVEAAIERANVLRAQGKQADAEAILQGLGELYRDDPSAAEIRTKLRQK